MNMFDEKPRPYFGKTRYRNRMWRVISHYVTPEKTFGPTIRMGAVDNDGIVLEIVEFDFDAPGWCMCPFIAFNAKWDMQSGDDEIACICGCQELRRQAWDEENARTEDRIRANADEHPALREAKAIIVGATPPTECNGQHDNTIGVRVIWSGK